MAGDIGRERRGEKDRRPGHVGRRAHAPLGNMRKRARQPVGVPGGDFGQLGIDQPGGEPVDADAFGGKGLAQRPGQADRAGL